VTAGWLASVALPIVTTDRDLVGCGWRIDGSPLLSRALPAILVGRTSCRVMTAEHGWPPTFWVPQGRSFDGSPRGSRMYKPPRPTPWILQGREQDMYALIRQYEGLDATVRETATRKANLELRPILAKSPGFVSYELIKPDGKTDAVTSISVFKTRADAEASNTVAGDWVHTNLPSMTKPSKMAGELVAH
jgi:hypothetical protein